MDSLMKINFSVGSNKLKLILILTLVNFICNCHAGFSYTKKQSMLVNFCKNAYNSELISPMMEFQRKEVNAAFEISACYNDVSVNENYYMYKMQAFNIYVPVALYSDFWKIITNKSALDADFIEKNTENDKYPYVLYIVDLNKMIFIEKN